jgi:hypothetical protein
MSERIATPSSHAGLRGRPLMGVFLMASAASRLFSEDALSTPLSSDVGVGDLPEGLLTGVPAFEPSAGTQPSSKGGSHAWSSYGHGNLLGPVLLLGVPLWLSRSKIPPFVFSDLTVGHVLLLDVADGEEGTTRRRARRKVSAASFTTEATPTQPARCTNRP